MTRFSRYIAVMASAFIICLLFILGNRSTLQLCKGFASVTDQNVIDGSNDTGIEVGSNDTAIEVGSNDTAIAVVEAGSNDTAIPVVEVWNTQGFIPKRKALDSNCPRFATISHKYHVGLGHKFAEVVFGMILAEETNSTFVLDARVWSHTGQHGSYSWLLDFLPLDESEVTNFELKSFSRHTPIVKVLDGWETLIEKSKNTTYSCNVFFTSYLDWCCRRKCYCTSTTNFTGVYDRVKWRMREAYSRTRYHPTSTLRELSPGVSNGPIITVAWHIRIGDITLNANEKHFDQLASQISSVLNQVRHIPVHFFFMGEGNITRRFPFIPKICQYYFEGNCSQLDSDVRDTLFHMVHSDILITSGSSLPSFAAILRTDGMVLYEYAKEKVLGLFEVSGQGLIHPNGTILTPTLQAFEFQLRHTYNEHLKKMMMLPPRTSAQPQGQYTISSLSSL